MLLKFENHLTDEVREFEANQINEIKDFARRSTSEGGESELYFEDGQENFSGLVQFNLLSTILKAYNDVDCGHNIFWREYLKEDPFALEIVKRQKMNIEHLYNLYTTNMFEIRFNDYKDLWCELRFIDTPQGKDVVYDDELDIDWKEQCISFMNRNFSVFYIDEKNDRVWYGN